MPPSRCPECGADSRPDSDFCPACGAYLAWDALATAAVPPIEAAVTAVVHPVATARLLVRVAGLDLDDPPAHDALRVAPGSPLVLTATVRNESAIDDSFAVAVEGLPPNWVDVRPSESFLLPAGARGNPEGEVTITVTPPRVSSTRPGRWPFAVTVSSLSRAAEDMRIGAALTVEPFGALELVARPSVAVGRRGAVFTCEVRNLGNGEAHVALLASDAAQACWFDLPAQLRMRPGETTRTEVRVRPARTLWVGRPVDHRVLADARAPEAPAPAKAPPLVYRQQPWVPWWAPALILLLAGLALALYLALPRKVTMPAVTGAPDAVTAQQQLSHAGLQAHPQIKVEIRRHVAAGTVVGQIPSAGTRVPASTPVTLVVAATPATTIVPDLTGLEPAQADTVLARVHLTLGAVSPQLDPKARVATQLPRPGSVRPQGTSVEVVLAPRTATVPDVRGLSLSAAQSVLKRAGLSLGNVAPQLTPHAKVGSQLPAAGMHSVRGTKVDVTLLRPTVLVPDLAGMSVQGADAALGICGLRLGPLPPSIRPGQPVASQVPAAGARRAQGAAVTVILGPEPAAGAPTPAPPPLPTPAECALR